MCIEQNIFLTRFIIFLIRLNLKYKSDAKSSFCLISL